MTTLSHVLAELREEKGLSQNELAKELEISRGYYSLLEGSGGKEPSLEFLRKLSQLLVGRELGSPTQFHAALRLGLAALGFESTDPHAKWLGSVPEELHAQADPSLDEVWVISEILGEILSKELLTLTTNNLTKKKPVHYTYFVPHGYSQWPACLALLRSTIADKGLDPSILGDGRLTAIACPPMTCIIPIRILTLSSSQRLPAVTLGNPTTKTPLLYELDSGSCNRIVAELTGVTSNLRLRPSWSSDYATYRRLYPQETAPNE